MNIPMPPAYMMIDPMVEACESDVNRRAKSLVILSIMMISFDNGQDERALLVGLLDRVVRHPLRPILTLLLYFGELLLAMVDKGLPNHPHDFQRLRLLAKGFTI